jgi:NADH dehydrogenase/NADH:ubiquinone oxidoreductase subunit G
MGGKLLPSCQQTASDGMVVYSDSPKAVANQKAVMEYLLINHPLDCPVCDQSGECFLQDYSYEYGRGVSRFEEQKVKQPKKDVGPHVLLYSDRCIMCTRCVRFTREVTGTASSPCKAAATRKRSTLPRRSLDNELSANVVDLCPVGALLDKDFLFAQRVWFLKRDPVDRRPHRQRRQHLHRAQRGQGLPHQAPHQPQDQQVVDHRRGPLRLEVCPRRRAPPHAHAQAVWHRRSSATTAAPTTT